MTCDYRKKQLIALITGATGQDARPLCELLLSKGYKVVGMCRRTSTNNKQNLEGILDSPNLITELGDLTDRSSIDRLIIKYLPNELYHLGAMSNVHTSFEQPELTIQVNTIGTLNLLESIRHNSPKTKFYFAGTSESFGSNIDEDGFQRETTPFCANSPYGASKIAGFHLTKLYREAYGLYACSACMFNHEGIYRSSDFVSRKITKYVAKLNKELKSNIDYDEIVEKIGLLRLGNLNAYRDFGHSENYVLAMHLMLQQKGIPQDFVIGTGFSHSVAEFVSVAFGYVGIKNWQDYIEIDPSLYRACEVPHLKCDATKAKEKLGWEPTTSFEQLVSLMLENDIKNEQ